MYILQQDTRCYYVCGPSQYNINQQICNMTEGVNAVTITDEGHNIFMQSILESSKATKAYIGLISTDGDTFSWQDGDTSNFRKLLEPTTLAATTTTATRPPTIRTTAKPGDRRKDTSVTVLVDSSIFSTTSNTMGMISFYQSLAARISDRGNANFGLNYFGCNTHSCTAMQNYETMMSSLSSFTDTIMNTCVRTNPFDFSSAIDELAFCYYSRYPIMQPQYIFRAVIIFSTITDPQLISQASNLTAQANSVVITIAVGPNAIPLSSYSLPTSYNLNITDFSDVDSLVLKVDSLIYSYTGASQFMTIENNIDISNNADTTTQICTYISADDGFWYKTNCTAPYSMICAGPAPEVVPTDDPAYDKPCNDEFTYFKSLNNGNCYRISDKDPQTFASAQSECQMISLQKPPMISSVLSDAEMTALGEMLEHGANNSEGMFWIGLSKNDDESLDWAWTNGDAYDPAQYELPWRDGYPRLATGANCVAYVLNDQTCINTDCHKKLRPLCSYRLF